VKKHCEGPGRKAFGYFGSDPRTQIFSALACGHRVEIIKLLRDGEKSTVEIAPLLNIDISVLSRHLAVLRNCGLVKCRKDGVQNFYRVTDTTLFDLLDTARDMLRTRAEANRQLFEDL